jgi:hypothetical protein
MSVYYNPEKHGLRIFDELHEPGLAWEFNFVCVWEDLETHRLYYAQDAGCSCPSPFEDIRDRSGLTPLDDTMPSWKAFRTTCMLTAPWGHPGGSEEDWVGGSSPWDADRADLESKIVSHLREHG